MKKEQLLAEVEDVLRAMPRSDAFGGDDEEPLVWLGRALATIQRWNTVYMPASNYAADRLRSPYVEDIASGYSQLKTLLNQARADLRMDVGQLSVVIPSGNVFDYFNELRKVIETARTEVFFVDQYLTAEFVERYLPSVVSGVSVRLLGRKHMAALLPAIDLFAQQSHLTIHVRSSAALHDRFLFVDRSACYFSGASFKDGGKSAPALLTQITDAFQAMWDTYEGLWTTGKVERG